MFLCGTIADSWEASLDGFTSNIRDGTNIEGIHHAGFIMKIIHETEIAVIGAGAVGCSIAYFLAKRGKAVTVIDAKGIGAGTTSATLGLVWTQGKQPAEYMELN